MSFRLEKTMRIVDELVGFCCRRGGKNITINYNTEKPKMTEITVTSPNTTVTSDELTALDKTLSQHRQHEMEEMYWLISGDDSFGDELSLVGVMVDECKIIYENEVLTIIVYRNED